ncbi:MAG TPA: response regulator [Opitutaceae bacterium]|nr:response regulator [Opitutaceae bacterium]
MAKILLIDDSTTLLTLIKRMLIAGGHEVIATASGSGAVEHLATSRVDLVLTDLYMPPPDGFEIVQAVRALPEPPPLVVMSSNTQAYEVFRDARALGAAAALQKPFSAEQLLETIQSVLSNAAKMVSTSAPLTTDIGVGADEAVLPPR